MRTKLTPVNPSYLKVGEKYFIEVELMKIDNDPDTTIPYKVRLPDNALYWINKCALLTLTPSTEPDNEELKMLVEVASRLYAVSNNPSAAVGALELINNCKDLLKQKP